MITGECHCGVIRYQIDGTLRNARACHCSRCRKVFGGASSAYGELEDVEAFSWTGGQEQLTQYTAANGWGIGFCRCCGSTLCVLFQGKVQGVTLGAVNGDPGVQLSMHIFVGSKAPWDHIGGGAPQFAEWPPDPPTARG